MVKKFTSSILICFLLLSAFPAKGFSQGYSRNVNAVFDNLQLYIDGYAFHASREPFIVDGDVYVSLRDLSKGLSLEYNYSDKDKQAVLKKQGSSNKSNQETYAAQLVQRDYQITALNQELKELELQSEAYTDTKYKNANIRTDSEMQAYLEDYFETLNGIPMTIQFYNYRSDQYRLHITFPFSDRGNFDMISERTIKRYLEDILYVIRDKYNSHADIDGYIRDNRSSAYRTYVEFETESDRLEFIFNRSDTSAPQFNEANRIKTTLESRVSTYNNIRFYYEVYMDTNNIDLTISFYNEDFYDLSSGKKRDFLGVVKDEIEDLYDNKTVYGRIIDNNNNKEVLTFRFEDGKISTTNVESSGTKLVVPKEKEANPSITTAITRDLTILYNNIALSLDQQTIYFSKEPFIYDGELYIPLADFADDLYMGYRYDTEEKKIFISTNSTLHSNSEKALLEKLFSKNEEINRLTELVADLRENVTELQNLPYDIGRIISASKMEAYLQEYYGTIEDIDTTISFRQYEGNDFRLRITYNNSDFDDFNPIANRIIEGWVYDMYAAARDLYNPYIKVSGSIRNTPSNGTDITYITFKTEDRQLSFNFEEHGGSASKSVDINDLANELNSYLKRYNRVYFYYDVASVRKRADITVYFNDSSFYDWSEYRKKSYLEELQDTINSYYGPVNVNGRIIDTSTNEEVLRFSFKDGIIHSVTLFEELENNLNKYNKRFTYNNNNFNFTYQITEKNANNYIVKLEGDFSKSNATWKSVEEYGMTNFNSFVLDALRIIQSVFPVNLTAEIYDRNQEYITSVTLSK